MLTLALMKEAADHGTHRHERARSSCRVFEPKVSLRFWARLLCTTSARPSAAASASALLAAFCHHLDAAFTHSRVSNPSAT